MEDFITTSQERYLIRVLREMKPYQSLVIEADKEGKPGRYLLRKSEAIMVSELSINPIKVAIINN